MKKTTNKTILATLALLSLAACLPFGKEREPPLCPLAYKVAPLDDITDAGGKANATPLDLRYQASIGRIDMLCSWRGDDVALDVMVPIKVQRGPALKDDTLTFPYFVAVQDDKGVIRSQQQFSVTIKLGPELSKTQTEELGVRIPKIDGRAVASWRVLVGFALKPEQVQR